MNLLLKASQGPWTDLKVTLSSLKPKTKQERVHFTAAFRSKWVGPRGCHFGISHCGPLRRWASLPTPCYTCCLPFPAKGISFSCKQLTLLESGLRGPEPEVICFCCIWWNIVAYSSQGLSHFLKWNLPTDWHCHTVNVWTHGPGINFCSFRCLTVSSIHPTLHCFSLRVWFFLFPDTE